MHHTHDVRKRFLDYFQSKQHAAITSSPVVPHDDPTLLFTNAGMNQFKDIFLGKTPPEHPRAASSQKCIRVGGKHNDLENVGHTSRHLTFFEMLGNFSFGDYFKEKAIDFAWEVSTSIFKFAPEQIWASVFRDDDESFELWTRYLPTTRIVRLGEKDNFWAMGDIGPCGPCSELLYDRGSHFSLANSPIEDPSGERYLEFWNLVFMQYNRRPDGTLEPLPKPSIDTGAGLERVMSLIQNKESLFETDVLRSIIASIEELSQIKYQPEESSAAAFRVIADHLRCLAFAIADGAQPSNVDRGYVLRKVLRRAVRYGKTLGFEAPFLARLVPRLLELMGRDYKELIVAKGRIEEIVTQEEEAFFRTLKRGGQLLNQVIASSKAKQEISGKDAFTLKDTYGLPLDEVLLIAKDNALHVDVKGFEALEKEAKEKSKAAQKSSSQTVQENFYQELLDKHGPCRFERDKTQTPAHILALIAGGAFVKTLDEGQEGVVILDTTSFYAEMGGQVGDTGEIAADGGSFTVASCTSPFKGITAHHGKVSFGTLVVGQEATATIDTLRREKIARNHTATHLLHWALHQVLGEHTKQAGSVVDAERLRFDFSHHKALTEEEIRTIELLVNEKIRRNVSVAAYELPYEEVQKNHEIKQFFGDKYGKVVRVIDIDFSKELCGGSHIEHTGQIGYFRIAKESAIAAGTRRIEAVTGYEAEQLAYQPVAIIDTLASHLKVPATKVLERVEKLLQETKGIEAELKQLQKEKLASLAATLVLATSPSGIPYCISKVNLKAGDLKLLADELAIRLPSSVLALACQENQKAHLLVRVSQDLVTKGIKANELIKASLATLDGSGGGKAEMAQGAGKAVEKIDQALQQLSKMLASNPLESNPLA